METRDDEEKLLRSVALQNAQSILLARQRAEEEALRTKEVLERRTEELAQQHEWFQTTLSSIGDAVIATDTHGKVTFLNPVAEKLTGWNSRDAAGQSLEEIFNIVNEDTRQPALNPVSQVMQKGITVGLANHTVLISRTGIEVSIEDSAAPIRDSGGKISGAVMVFHDGTERRHAEGALARLAAIVESSDDAIIGKTLDGIVTNWNKSAERILGYRADEMIGQPITKTIPVERHAEEAFILEQLRQGHAVKHYESVRVTSDGRRIDVSLTSSPILDGEGRVIGASKILRDITEHKQSREALRENEERLRAIFSQAAVGMAIASLDGHFLETNAKFSQILGYSPTELQQMTFIDITHPDDLVRTRDNTRRLLAGEISDFVYEKRYLRKDGATVWSLTTVTLLKDSAGQPRRFIGVIEDITQRKQAELEQARLTDILDKSLNEIYIFDAETLRFQYVNRGALLNLGYSREAMHGMTPLDLKPAFTEASFREMVRPLLKGEKEKHIFRTIHRRFDSSDYPVEVHLQVAAHAGQRVFLAVVLDITERKKAEEALRRNETELRALADSIPQLAWMAHPDGHIFWYNRRWYEYTGTSFEQMQGWGWQSVHDPEILPRVVERWKASIRTGEPFEMEFPLRGADGEFRWFLTRVHPLRDTAGSVLRWFGTNTDVDQVKQVREALRDETRILELLNNTGTTLSSKLDLQTLVQTVTDAATQLSGAKFGAFFYNVLNAEGESYMLYTLSGAPRAAFEKFGLPRNTPVFNPTFRGEGPLRSDDITRDPRYGKMPPHHGMPPGHLPVCSYLAVPVTSRSGEVIGGLFFGHPEPGVFTERHERIILGVAAQAAIAIDNARLYEAAQTAAEERKQLLESERAARAEAERTNELKDLFLANLSHELRTPLSAILGWSQVLRSRDADDADLRQGLEAIERGARMQTQLIEDLLDMSRITSGKVRLDIQPVEPVAFIEAAMETIRPAADAKGIRLEKLLDPAAGPISGDPGRLQQIVWNLLSNAIKFTPKAGKVQVVLERVNSHIEISVADTGIGIKPGFLPHLFERFRQADASTTRRHGGLGLGLSIVKHLVELHGGTVRAKSPGEGCGTTFTIHLPLTVVHRNVHNGERLHPGTSQLASMDFHPTDLSGIKVLVVDDEADARDLIRRVLTDCNAAVLTAGSAGEALPLVESERPHVLVSDIGMPDVDGYEFLRRVRMLGQVRGGKIPAIALTAFARSEDRTRALRAGFLVHVSKPVEPSELVATIASVTGRTGEAEPE
jgi:PAS domain S-box-containing protein